MKVFPAKLTDAQAQQVFAHGARTNWQDNQSPRASDACRNASGDSGEADRRTGAAGARYRARTNWRDYRPDALQTLATALQALAAKLTDAQAQQALATVLEEMGETTDPDALQALAGAFQALAAKLPEVQAQQSLATVLEEIGETTDPDALQTLAGALQAVPANLTDAQAQQALAPILEQIDKATDPDALKSLAKALQALAAKLSEPSARQALIVAASSLAWAATEDEAVDWARAVVALLPSTANQADQNENRRLISAILYPAAAGPATEVLLNALRARRPDAPKEAGTATIMAWVAEKYPNEVRQPICPPLRRPGHRA